MIKHNKPNCPRCRGLNRARYVSIAYGSVPDDKDRRFSDIWICNKHRIHIAEVIGTLTYE